LDGNTHSADREKMINQFNSNNNRDIHLFLLSTRYGRGCCVKLLTKVIFYRFPSQAATCLVSNHSKVGIVLSALFKHTTS